MSFVQFQIILGVLILMVLVGALDCMRYVSCFVLAVVSGHVMSFHLFTHILQGCVNGPGASTWLPQCQWSNPEEYGLKSMCA